MVYLCSTVLIKTYMLHSHSAIELRQVELRSYGHALDRSKPILVAIRDRPTDDSAQLYQSTPMSSSFTLSASAYVRHACAGSPHRCGPLYRGSRRTNRFQEVLHQRPSPSDPIPSPAFQGT